MKSENAVIRQYLGEVRSCLNCPRSVKAAFLKDLKEDAVLFAAQQPIVTREILCGRFGTPREIANGFLDREETALLLQKAKKRALRWRIVGILASIMLLLAFVYLLHIIYETTGYITVSDVY